MEGVGVVVGRAFGGLVLGEVFSLMTSIHAIVDNRMLVRLGDMDEEPRDELERVEELISPAASGRRLIFSREGAS